MRLVSVTIKDFRSITAANRVPLSGFSVLLGPNNEGKSNILAAIVISLALLSQGRSGYRRQALRYRYNELNSYFWTRDFPVALQSSKPSGKSQVTLEFELGPEEKRRFKTQTKMNLSANLRLKIEFGKEDAKVDLLLSGPLKRGLTESKINLIAKFVEESIYIQYVPAVRTEEMSQRAIEQLLSDRLRLLERNEEYAGHLQALERLQRPVLEGLSHELTQTVKGFLPDVQFVTVSSDMGIARAVSRSTSIEIDDGTKTSIRLKGDGIKSLTAISLMRHLGHVGLNDRSMILAVEEPESHLHPSAIHKLRDVLKEVSKDCQVILTTHCATLVERSEPRKNILVLSGKAAPAKTIGEVGAALGVQQSDNLASARLVLLVEGVHDVAMVRTWLMSADADIRGAIESGLLGFDSLDGVGNLSYKARTHIANVAEVHAFIDNDEAAKLALRVAIEMGAIRDADYTAAVWPGVPNSEIEDLVDESVYLDEINRTMGVVLDLAEIRKLKMAWSARMNLVLSRLGKMWSKELELKLKRIASERAVNSGIASLSEKRRASFDSLVESLRFRMGFV